MTINIDGSVTVEDDGRGIPVEIASRPGLFHAEGVMTVLKFGGKFDKGAYKPPAACTASASRSSTSSPSGARSKSAAAATSISRSTSAACPPADVRRIGTTDKRGTKTTFKPDPQIFPNTKFVYNTLHRRLQELAFLNAA